MAIKKLILGRNNDQTNIVFDKQVNIVDDLVLSKELSTENIKNEDSTLILKSMSDTQIADVIQIKINLTSVGTLLVNFNKDGLTEDDRKSMFDALTALKNKEEPTEKTQSEKFIKIISIIDKYKPEYVAFTSKGTIKINVNEIAKKNKWNFPLLVLAIPPKTPTLFERLKKFKLFQGKYIQSDYIFTGIFALLASFALIAGISELFGEQNMAIFFLVLTGIFTIIGTYINYKILIPEKDKLLKFAIMIYAAIGWLIGVIASTIVSKYLLYQDPVTFETAKIMLIGGLGSLILSQGIIWLTFPIQKLIKKIKK